MPLPLLLSRVPPPLPLEALERGQLTAKRKLAVDWAGPGHGKCSHEECVAAIRRGMSDPKAAARIAAALKPDERAVLAVYRGYGGIVDGKVSRLELLTRRLMAIQTSTTSHFQWSRWKVDWVERLIQRWYLVKPAAVAAFWSSRGFSDHFAALADSQRLQPFLLGSPGTGWLLVRKEKREELASVLAELGIEVSDRLPE
jgi:hypothetical protein